MISKKIGFIGCGNMGGAILSGMIKAKAIDAKNVYIYDISDTACENHVKQYGVNRAKSNIDLVKSVDVVLFAIKPIYAKGVFSEISDSIKDGTLLLSIVAGIDLPVLEKLLGKERSIVKIMPNTPAAVNEGMSMITFNTNVLQLEKEIVYAIFSSIGKYEELDGRLVHAFTAACGSAPAYIFMLIEAMADAAVMDGIPRDKAYKMVAQTVYGSAKMVAETNKHPGVLKDEVCSPGGITIKGVKVLEDTGFRSSIMTCMESVIEKSKELSK